MKFADNPAIQSILLKTEKVYFEGGDWKSFLLVSLEQLEVNSVELPSSSPVSKVGKFLS